MGRTCSGYSVCTKSGDCDQQLFGTCCSVLTPAASYPTNTPVATPTPATWPYTLRTFYQFNDNTSSATITKSSVSPTYDGTNSGVTHTTTGAIDGGAGVFGGSQFFTVPHNSTLNLGTEFTISAWINPTAVAAEMPIVSKKGSAGNYSYEFVRTSAGKLSLVVSEDGSTITTYTSITSVTNAVWQKATVTYNSGTVVFYVNSTSEAAQVNSLSTPYPSTADVLVGKNIAGSFFTGEIDEVCVYGQQLSSTDIATLAGATCSGTQGLASSGVIATGGSITDLGGYRIHTFTSSGTFTVTQGGLVEYLIVAGGGGAGNSVGGGGGGGGLRGGTFTRIAANSYSIAVGSGGAGGAGGGSQQPGTNGGNSSFNSIIAIGGGGGAGNSSGAPQIGGSGGGGAQSNITGADGTSGQGSKGGNQTQQSLAYGTGGGGGAGGVGGNGTSNTAGNGGVGLSSGISGSTIFYAGGGAGGGYSTGGAYTAGTGGNGGGGNGGNSTVNSAGGNGTNGLGGGGGSGNYQSSYSAGGNGGSGIVIVRYPFYSDGPAATATPTSIPAPTTPFTLALSHTTPSTVVAGRPVQWAVTISNPTNASQAAWAFNLLVTVPSSVTGVVWKCEVTNVGTPRGEMMAYPTTCAGSGTAAYVDANTYQITLGHTGSADPLIHPGGNIKVTVGGFIKKSAGSTNLTMSAIISNYSGWPTNALYSVNRLTNSAPQGPTPTLSTLAVPTVVPISINPIIGAALTATPTPTLYPVQPTSTSAPTPTPTLTPTPPPVVRSTCQDTNKVLRTLVNNQSQYYCATATNDLVVVKGTTVEKLNGINTQILNLDFQNGGVVNGVQLVRVVMKVQSVIKVQGATQPLARDYSLVLRMR
ncbi:MAG: LamG domain-containing protein [bacterium]